jgi:hypothetical protein
VSSHLNAVQLDPTIDERLDKLEAQQAEMLKLQTDSNEKIGNLLKGLQQFLEFAEQMKGHPLLSAFAPPGGPKKK